MDEFDAIRLEVAKKHDVLIDKNDPALMTVTLNRVMFEKYIQLLTERNTELLVAINAAQQQGIADAKITAGRVITDTGNYLEERVRTGLIDATKDLVAKHKKDLGEAWVQIELARKTVIACAVLTVFCTIVSVGVLFKAVA